MKTQAGCWAGNCEGHELCGAGQQRSRKGCWTAWRHWLGYVFSIFSNVPQAEMYAKVYSCMSRASQTAFTMARHLNVRLEVWRSYWSSKFHFPKIMWLVNRYMYVQTKLWLAVHRMKLYFHRAEFQEQTDPIDILVCHANVIRYFNVVCYMQYAWSRCISSCFTELCSCQLQCGSV